MTVWILYIEGLLIIALLAFVAGFLVGDAD